MKKSPPKHLSRESKALWRDIVAEYELEDSAGLALLGQACEALDRVRSAQAQIEKDGELVADRFGQLKPHPLLTSERDSRGQFLAALKALNLDLEPLRDRPTRRTGA